jgi:cytochrome c peroxidase
MASPLHVETGSLKTVALRLIKEMMKFTNEAAEEVSIGSQLECWMRICGILKLGVSILLIADVATAQMPPSLKTVPVPQPNLVSLGYQRPGVAAQKALVVLGKALYWDMQVGSDGIQACASCHFHAGADHRIKNQLNPGHDGVINLIGNSGGANYTLEASDFPFHQLAVVDDRTSAVLRDRNDRASSQGVSRLNFLDVVPGSPVDVAAGALPDPPFAVGGGNVRRVEPRNTPTVINAVFNHRNFWDGRANFFYNGTNPLGPPGLLDPLARILSISGGIPALESPSIPFSSLASQASGPPVSFFEMSSAGRNWKKIGKKMLSLTPLGEQKVDPTDSVLGPYAAPKAGLTVKYGDLIRQTFQPKYWDSSLLFDLAGSQVGNGQPITTDQFTLMEYNFSLFFGLAVQAYEATLISDDTPFDRFREGDANALTEEQKLGLTVFLNKGRCIVCHSGAELTSAAVSQVTSKGTVELELLRNGMIVKHDTGFFNTGVRPNEDLGLGDSSFQPPLPFAPPALGYFKTPGIRNVELTGPFFHNGGQGTLADVVEFYDRGGDFENPQVDVNITALNLTEEEDDALAEFMLALTDDRVRYERAPFDHPQLCVPNGSPGNATQIAQYGPNGYGRDSLLEIPAVGATGEKFPLQTFEELLNGIVSQRSHTMKQGCALGEFKR